MIKGFETFKDEASYIPPEEVEHASVKRAKSRNIKIGRVAIFSKTDVLA